MLDMYDVDSRMSSELEAVRGVDAGGVVVYGPEAIPNTVLERHMAAMRMKRAGATEMQWLDADLSLSGVYRTVDITSLIDVNDD